MKNIIKFFISTLFICLLVSGWFLTNQKSNNLKVYFCDVGQGDAIYIRLPEGADFLVDAGRGNKILECLGEYMPFYDRKIEAVILTHPQADHLDGLVEVLQRYKVDLFLTSPVGNTTAGYRKLADLLKDKNTSVGNLYKGDIISLGEVSYTAIWPQKQWVLAHLNCGVSSRCVTLADNNSSVLGIQSERTDLNDFSQMGVLTYKDFDLLLTGDGDSRIQNEVLSAVSGKKWELEVMKVPHHGSKTGLDEDFLQYFKPKLAVISVGKNSYGHPSGEIIERLTLAGAKVERTDSGTVIVESDGKTWKVVRQ